MRKFLQRRRFRLPIAIAATAWLAGCDLGPDYRRPALDLPRSLPGDPAERRGRMAVGGLVAGFHSAELNALIQQARTANFDIAAAIARVRQADAQVRIAGAPLLPDITGNRRRELAAYGLGTGSSSAGRASRRQRQYRLPQLQRRPERQLRTGFLGPQPRHPAVRGGLRHVQPLRPADRGADRGHQRRQYLVHRAGVRRPARRGTRQPGSGGTDPGGDPRPLRRRHRQRARHRAAGGPGRRRTGQHPQPDQPDGAAGHRPRHPDRSAAGADRRCGRIR